MSLPPTALPLKYSDPACDCPPDDKLLFGPKSTDWVSKLFTVREGDVMLVEFYGLDADTHIDFEKHITVCGAPYKRAALDLCGCCIEACADTPQAVLTIPGSYRAVIRDFPVGNRQDHTSIVGQICPLTAKLNINLECG
jgi:hypothetical protein